MDGGDIKKAQQGAKMASGVAAMGPAGWGAIAIGCGCLVILLLFMGIVALGVFALNNQDDMGSISDAIDIDDDRTDISAEEFQQIFLAAEGVTGTPWELSAAILCNESSCGRNFGSCSYFPEAPSNGFVLTSGGGLRSQGDKDIFEQLVIGLSYPKNKPVSCPARVDGQIRGNGGAMGYMQMMPSEWAGGSSVISGIGIATEPMNPWNAQEAAYIASRLIRCKSWEFRAGDQAYCDLGEPFPETELYIKRAADCYLGCGNGTDYADKVYLKYLEFNNAGRIVF